jgi:alpha-methylacyl-CoA racemase
MAGLLEGVTVLDLSSVGPGARCTAALRDLGAELIKVVAPAGAGRVEPEHWAYGGARGTRTVELDLKTENGRSEFVRLAADADVVVESFRPGVVDRLGIGYDAVRDANPDVVYASVTGYGQDGPYSAWAGHDLNYLSVGGYLGTSGRRDDGGPALPGATIADGAGGGLQAALSIASALFQREKTGEGAYLDVATAEGVLHLMGLFVDEYLTTGRETKPGNSLLTGKYACYDIYECADGKWLSVGAIESKFFANLCRGLGLEALASAQYDDDRQDELRLALKEAFRGQDRDSWVRALAPADTCVAPVLTVAEVAEDEHFNARNVFTKADHVDPGPLKKLARILAGSDRTASE